MSDKTGIPEEFEGFIDGVAVVFDDEARTDGTVAKKFIDELRNADFPVVEYIEPPSEKPRLIKNLYGSAFIVLDWKFLKITESAKKNGAGETLPTDAPISLAGASELARSIDEQGVDSLKLLLNSTYCPIFIVTQESVEDIAKKLRESDILPDGSHPRVFICQKSELLSDSKKFWERMVGWMANSQPIYTLKTLERAVRQAKQELFLSLEGHPEWPSVLWHTYDNDDENASVALAQFICKQIVQRTIYKCEFSEPPKRRLSEEACNHVGTIISSDRYLKFSDKSDEPYVAGDVFAIGGCYYVNVRASCDTMHSNPADLYLLPCYDVNDVPDDYCDKRHVLHAQGGQLVRWNKSFIIPYSIEGKTVEVDFSKLKIVGMGDGDRGKRIGRLLPPFLTRLQQLFSSFVVREGLPATPQRLLNEWSGKAAATESK